MIPIEGDVSEIGLGISECDIKRMENVSIIVHASASVRFDDPLKSAILTNVRSTREIINMALNLKHLLVLFHVSTAYCNSDFKIIEEKIYPPHGDWREAIKLAETSDDQTINVLTAKYIDFLPNTYLYTKGLAENMCDDYKTKLPIVVYRPAIVTGAVEEPIPGYVDNFNGCV